jgi:hypothetical protein
LEVPGVLAGAVDGDLIAAAARPESWICRNKECVAQVATPQASDTAIMPDGSIYIIYDYNRYNGGNILFARITEEDILAARLSGENSCTGHLISSTRCK